MTQHPSREVAWEGFIRQEVERCIRRGGKCTQTDVRDIAARLRVSYSAVLEIAREENP